MDLPINIDELRIIVISLQKAGVHDIADRLKLVEQLMAEGKPHKKILREQYNIVA
jgi:hypothetical protein